MCCTVLKCCCCIDLKTGTIIIASLSLLGSASCLSYTAWMAFVSNETAKIIESHFMDSDFQQSDDNKALAVLFLRAFFWTMLIVAVVSGLAVILDIMLLAGAINARRRLLLAWLIGYGIIYCTFLLLLGLIVVCLIFTATTYEGIKIAAFGVVHGALMIYFWVVVRSYYQALGHQYGEGPPPAVGRTTAGKVYSTVPASDVPPAHGTYNYGEGIPMAATGPPHYVSSA